MYSKVIHIFSFLFSIMVYHRILNIVTSLYYKIGPCWLSILYNTVNFQMFKLVLEKAEEPEIKLPPSVWASKSKRDPEKHLFLLYQLCQSLWLCGSQWTVEILKEMGTSLPDLSLEKSICRSESNSYNWTWKNRLVPNRKRSMSRLYIVTLII